MEVTKNELYSLIDALSEKEIEVAKLFLEFLIARDEAVYALISASFDDEPVLKEEDIEAENAWNEHLKGESVSSDDAAREIFGE